MDIARRDSLLPTRHLLISGGSPGAREFDQSYFLETCSAVVEAARAGGPDDVGPLEVDIMMSARPHGEAFVDELVRIGVHGFAFNVELFSEEASIAYTRRKHVRARPYLEGMITRAVELLGRGTGRVRSLIVVGLEPVTSALAGVEWLAALGCDPVLSPFRPAQGTRLAGLESPSSELLRELLDRSRPIVAAHGVHLGPDCVPCQHNTLTFPWDTAGGSD